MRRDVCKDFLGGEARTGISDEDIARRADEDNENDEYHVPVSPLDVWAEYHRLRHEEKWEFDRIATAKSLLTEKGDLDLPLAGRRVKWHTSVPDNARKAICDGLLNEGHITAFDGVTCDVTSLSPWLTTAQAQAELVADVLSKHRGKGPDDKKPTVKVVREHAKRWKELIAAAEAAYAKLDESGVWRRAAPCCRPAATSPRSSWLCCAATDTTLKSARVSATT